MQETTEPWSHRLDLNAASLFRSAAKAFMDNVRPDGRLPRLPLPD
jgi:hypothetical protein